nr:hypothetical protein [Tanacetum cinerariifolium]
IQVAQKKVKIAFENADSSSKVELIPSKIEYANKVILNFHKEFLVFSSLSRKGNDRLLQDQVFKNKEEVVIKRMGIGTQQPEEPESTLEDEFQDLHLNLPVLEFLAHAPIYNAILDKYVEILELGKNRLAFVQGEVSTKMEDPGLFTLPCRLGDSKPFDTLADLGSCEVKDVEVHIGKMKLLNDFYVIDIKKDPETLLLVGRGFLATANAVIDCRIAKIVVGEGITRLVFGVKGVNLGEEEAPYWTTLRKKESYKPRPSSDGAGAQIPYYARKDFLDCHFLEDWKIARDAEINPFKDFLVFRRMAEFFGAIPINLKSNIANQGSTDFFYLFSYPFIHFYRTKNQFHFTIMNKKIDKRKGRNVERGVLERESREKKEMVNSGKSGSESRPPILNKENYVPWSSRLLRYAKSKPNGKLIHNSILNGPYVRRMIPEPGDAERDVNTILLGLPEDTYAAVDSCKTAKEIWLRVQHMMKGSDIGIQEKKAKLFNEWERENCKQFEVFEQFAAEYTQLYDFLKYNQKEIISLNPRNRQIAQPSMNMGQDRQMQMVRGNGGNQFRQYAGQNAGNPAGYNDVIGNQVISNAAQNPRVHNVVRAEGNAARQNGNKIRCYNCRGIGHYASNSADLDEIEEVNANCILMANLQQASSSGTQTDSAPVYDSDGSAEVHEYENCYNNEIFNMFTQEEQYTELLEPIPEPQQVPQNDNNVISKVTNMEQEGKTVEQHSANFEETRTLYESLYQNLAIEVENVNSVNRKLKETNADLTTELARYKNQERCFEISQEKYDKLEKCYQQSIYQEQCLSKKINALHLSSGKQIMILNEQISELNKQLSKEKSTVSFLLEEKKKLKFDFKTCEDELLDKQIQLEKKIKDLNKLCLKWVNRFNRFNRFIYSHRSQTRFITLNRKWLWVIKI